MKKSTQLKFKSFHFHVHTAGWVRVQISMMREKDGWPRMIGLLHRALETSMNTKNSSVLALPILENNPGSQNNLDYRKGEPILKL